MWRTLTSCGSSIYVHLNSPKIQFAKSIRLQKYTIWRRVLAMQFALLAHWLFAFQNLWVQHWHIWFNVYWMGIIISKSAFAFSADYFLVKTLHKDRIALAQGSCVLSPLPHCASQRAEWDSLAWVFAINRATLCLLKGKTAGVWRAVWETAAI